MSDAANVAEVRLDADLEPQPHTPKAWWNAAIPIAVVVVRNKAEGGGKVEGGGLVMFDFNVRWGSCLRWTGSLLLVGF